jgi:plastocyanin
MNSKCFTIWSTALMLLAAPVSLQAVAAEWGTLKGRFVVEGTPPAPTPLAVSKDQFCIDKKPMNETVLVDESGNLANAVVYVFLGRRGKIEVHPDYEAKLKEPVELDNLGCSFHPHVALVRVGQTIDIKNSDPVGHNTKIEGKKNTFNQTIEVGKTIPYVIQQTEAMPAPGSCSIHPFMKGVVLVQDHPYMVASAADGTFEIVNVPAGKHEFQFWHESPGYLKNLKFAGGSTDRRGKAELEIPAGGTLDLGDIKVPASAL